MCRDCDIRAEEMHTWHAPAFHPRRGDEVEAWLKRRRDAYDKDSPHQPYRGAWTALDDALDNYRLHADTGTPLSRDEEEILP